MSVWTTPTTRSTGLLVTAAIWNTDIVENLKYLKTSPVFDTAVIIGAETTSGVRLDLESGTLAVREGDDSAYAPLIASVVNLPSGGSINFASGDVTITHSTNTLTFAGATSGYNFADGPVKTATTVSVGNATPAATGAGITFPASQSDSSDANTLDDYEEGTWTPALGGTWTANPTNMTGTYTKIGRVVYIRLLFQGGTKATSASGYFTGLPFATNTVGTGSVVDSNVGNRGLALFANTDRVWVVENTFSAGDNNCSGFYFN